MSTPPTDHAYPLDPMATVAYLQRALVEAQLFAAEQHELNAQPPRMWRDWILPPALAVVLSVVTVIAVTIIRLSGACGRTWP